MEIIFFKLKFNFFWQSILHDKKLFKKNQQKTVSISSKANYKFK